MTESGALKALFGSDAEVRRQVYPVDPALKERLQKASGLHFHASNFTVFEAQKSGKPAGYAVIMNEIGKSEPITFMVGITPKHKVSDVILMVFRESRGAEVKDARFMRQFRGKTSASHLRVNDDVLNYAGATLSSRAVARGVKKALVLVDALYQPGVHHSSAVHFQLPPTASAPVVRGGSPWLYRQQRYRMGTVCSVQLWSDSSSLAGEAIHEAFAELRQVDQTFSNYREDSELSYVNRTAATHPVQVSDEFWKLLNRARRGWRETAGAVDPTIGPLLRAWGFHEKRPAVPPRRELTAARERVGFQFVQMGSRQTVSFQRPGMELDFGGLAKGLAVQNVAVRMKSMGIRAGLVSLGESSLYAFGPQPGVWTLAIRDPQNPARVVARVELGSEVAVSTSGTYENRCDGSVPFSHIIDARTMIPYAKTGSATVFSGCGVNAEIASKALLLEAPVSVQSWLRVIGGDVRSRGLLLEEA
jgi:thiamine biosynthesis lipoprotein